MTTWEYRCLTWDRRGPITHQVQYWLLQDVTPEGLITINENTFVPTRDHMRVHSGDAHSRLEGQTDEGTEWFARRAGDSANGDVNHDVKGLISTLEAEGWELYSEVESTYGENENDPALKWISIEYKFRRELPQGQLLGTPESSKSSENQHTDSAKPPRKKDAGTVKRYTASADDSWSLSFGMYTFLAGVKIDFPDPAWLDGGDGDSNDPIGGKFVEWLDSQEIKIVKLFRLNADYLGFLETGLFTIYCPECEDRYPSLSIAKGNWSYYSGPLDTGGGTRFLCNQGHELWRIQSWIS